MSGVWVPVLIVALVMFMIIMKSRYRYLEGLRSTENPAGPRRKCAPA